VKKDNIRDYAAEAFRFYALSRSGEARSDDPAARADIEAVDRVIQTLRDEPDGDLAIRCLELVYFSQPRKLPGRGAISDRARYASVQLGLSEPVIYRKLRQLRRNLALERGLRIG